MVATAVVVVVVEAVAVVCKSVNRVVYLKTVAEVSMPPYTCQICRKSYTRYDALTRHMKATHSEKENDDYEQWTKDSEVNKTKRYDFFGHFNCHICGQEYGTRESLERHIMQKREIRKIILYLNSLNVCIV